MDPKAKKVKWEPTKARKPPDGIKSSDYSNARPFIPSYEKEEASPSMKMLMSMEYARVWQRERQELDKPVVKDEKSLPKSYVKKKEDAKADSKQNQKPKEHPKLKQLAVKKST